MKRVLILGIDGYIGWSLAIKLLNEGYEVCGVDNLSRRSLAKSLTPIPPISKREQYLYSYDNFIDRIACVNLEDYWLTQRILSYLKPDTIVHLAEQPSAPYSMKGPLQSLETQKGNVLGTLALLWAMREHCPDAHLVKLGTMGEYGTPECDIPEGVIPNFCLDKDIARICQQPAPTEKFCPMSGLLFPRSPVSFYHASKVHDTYNIKFACDTWGLRSTDIMQGVVFGLNEENPKHELITRFDYDEYFGTVINRFCTQIVINHPLTVYGGGRQIRSFLPLVDSLQCLKIAIDNPPSKGEYRTFNQFENIYSISQLASKVINAALEFGIECNEDIVNSIDNPRNEIENHYYNPERKNLIDLGYTPSEMDSLLVTLIGQLWKLRNEVDKTKIMPTTKWR